MFQPTPAALLRWSMLYFILGIVLGIYMSITQDFVIRPVHVHVNLIGWVSLSVAALIYKAYPQAATTRLAAAHFWISVVAIPVLLTMLYAFLRGVGQRPDGTSALEPVLGIASISLLVATLALAVNVFRNVRD